MNWVNWTCSQHLFPCVPLLTVRRSVQRDAVTVSVYLTLSSWALSFSQQEKKNKGPSEQGNFVCNHQHNHHKERRTNDTRLFSAPSSRRYNAATWRRNSVTPLQIRVIATALPRIINTLSLSVIMSLTIADWPFKQTSALKNHLMLLKHLTDCQARLVQPHCSWERVPLSVDVAAGPVTDSLRLPLTRSDPLSPLTGLW